MSDIATAPTSTLPVVPLYWSEFVCSLEKLRHKPYSRRMIERDWHRINPLEMVLLGCKTLADGIPASRDQGTFIMTMEDITEYMSCLPRYWLRVYTVLDQTMNGPDTPEHIINKCVIGIGHITQGIRRHEHLCPGFMSYCINDLQISTQSVSDSLKRKTQVLAEKQIIEQKLKTFDNEIHQLLEKTDRHGDSVVMETNLYDEILLDALLRIDRSQITAMPHSISIKCSLSVKDFPLVRSFLVNLENKNQKFSTSFIENTLTLSRHLSKCNSAPWPSHYDNCLFRLLQIIKLLTFDNHTLNSQNDHFPSLIVASLDEFILEWTNCLRDYSSSLSSLLDLIIVILAQCRNKYESNLESVVYFIRTHLKVLMNYSIEGFLSKNAMEFFVKLLEFVASLVECGYTPRETVDEVLPHLFGSFFGVCNHNVSCLLLEYGTLSVCSKHKDKLMNENLHHLVSLWKLFPSLDRATIQRKANLVHTYSLNVCLEIMNDIIIDMFDNYQLKESRDQGEESHNKQDESHNQEKVPNDQKEESHNQGEESPSQRDESRDQETSCDQGDELSDQCYNLSDISADGRMKDKKERFLLLSSLLELACAMIRNGDSISYMFASVLPQLFSPIYGSHPTKMNIEKMRKFFGEEPPPRETTIKWNVDKKQLAIQLLSLSSLSLSKEMSTPFELCGIVMPKITRSLDSMSFNDEEKLTLAVDILQITREALMSNHDIEEFVSHGLELVSFLLPQSSSMSDIKSFIRHIVLQHLVKAGPGSVLFLIRNSCVYFKTHFPQELDKIQPLFRALIFEGRRNEIRAVFRICRDPFKDEFYSQLRTHFYDISCYGNISQQMQPFCEIILKIMDLTKVLPPSKEEGEELSQEERERKQKKRINVSTVMKKMIKPVLEKINEIFDHGKYSEFNKGHGEHVLLETLSTIALFKTLFADELSSFVEYSNDELAAVFASKFPGEVYNNNSTIKFLYSIADRIEHMQVPRYSGLKSLLTSLLKQYLSTTAQLNTDTINYSGLLVAREEYLNTVIMALPRNENDLKNLVFKCHYNRCLWDTPFSLTVTTDGSYSLEENMRQTLLACYTEFISLLKDMGITHVSVNGQLVKSVDLFSEDLSLAELKGHRSIAVRAIDQKLGSSREGRIHERKIALLMQEENIEACFQVKAREPVKPQKFTASLNIGFFDCAKCCGSQIVGCYAPTGEHCERPLEIGLRVDSGFLSIYNSSGTEIENCEVLLCEEGLYFFKAYTNGHPYDTSQVWMQIFTKLLEVVPKGSTPSQSLESPPQEMPSGKDISSLVPAIIIPRNFPNQKTWDLLRRSVQPEMTGSILTCHHDFSPEWHTYYDHRPESVNCGVDIVLHSGFSNNDNQKLVPFFKRQISKINKDLAGLMFEQTMSNLLENEKLKEFRFLGKFISQYISKLVENGECDSKIIFENFDYDRWVNRSHSRGSGSIQTTSALSLSKKDIVRELERLANENVNNWIVQLNVEEMWDQSHRIMLQLRTFLGKYPLTKQNYELKKKYKEVQSVVIESTVIVPIGLLPRATQEELIHWIYHNEDRVWRYRGGRCGHETLNQFMNFIKQQSEENVSYPGVATFVLPRGGGKSLQDFKVENLIGYSVGEMVRHCRGNEDEEEPELPLDCYEVIVGWVHPKYQKLNLSIHMYSSVIKQAPARYIMCDVIQGSVERIIQGNVVFRFLNFLRLVKFIVKKRQESYAVQLQTGESEQFEQVLFIAWPIRISLWLYSLVINNIWWRQSPQPRLFNTTLSF